MRTATTIPITEARKRLFEIAREVQKPGVQYTLTEHGKPTVTILSARAFEVLSQADVSRRREALSKRLPYASVSDQVLSRMLPLVVRETSSRIYGAGESENAPYYAKELAKALLYVSLVETYGYPNELIDIGRWVRIGGEGSQTYVEADLIVDDPVHDQLIICAVAGERWYDERRDAALEELFALRSALPTRKEIYLVYYTRALKPDGHGTRAHSQLQERWLVVDGEEYTTLADWSASGEQVQKILPSFHG